MQLQRGRRRSSPEGSASTRASDDSRRSSFNGAGDVHRRKGEGRDETGERGVASTGPATFIAGRAAPIDGGEVHFDASTGPATFIAGRAPGLPLEAPPRLASTGPATFIAGRPRRVRWVGL